MKKTVKSVGIIYKITNKLNGKIYIGQTVQSINCRIQKHLYNATNNPESIIHLAINKYGIDSFTIEQVCSCFDLEELNKQEQYFIKYYNTLAPNGYNLDSGGKNRYLSELTKEKMRQVAKSRPKDHPSRLALNIYKNNFKKGKVGNVRTFIQDEMGNIYSSVVELARIVNGNPKAIHNSIRQNRPYKGIKYTKLKKVYNYK